MLMKLKDKFILVVALALPIFSVAFQSLMGRVASDSSAFRYIGWRMTEGANCYVDVWDHKGPIVFVFNALGYVLGIGPNILYAGVWMLVVVGAFCLARKFSEAVAPWTALLFSILGVGMASGVFIVNVEITAALFSVWALWVALDFKRPIRFALSGACVGLAFMTKPNLIGGGVAIALWMLMLWIHKQVSIRDFFKCTLLALVGFVLVVGGISLLFWLHDSCGRMWDAMLLYNAFEYASQDDISRLQWWMRYLRTTVFAFRSGWWVLPSYVILFALALWRGFLNLIRRDSYGSLIAFWLVCETGAAFCAKQFFGHYLIICLLPVSILIVQLCHDYGNRYVRGFIVIAVMGMSVLYSVSSAVGFRTAANYGKITVEAKARVHDLIPQGEQVACFGKSGAAELMEATGLWSSQCYQFADWFWSYAKADRRDQMSIDLLMTLQRSDIRYFLFDGKTTIDDLFVGYPLVRKELLKWRLVLRTILADVYVKEM